MAIHEVKQGEDLAAIAHIYGTTQDALWSLEENEELWEKRPDPSMLRPGDKITIPEREVKRVKASTGARHRFRIKGAIPRVKMRLLEGDEVQAGVAYVFKAVTADGTELPYVKGETDADGLLDQPIPPNATTAEITINPGSDERVLFIRFGHLDPVREGARGVQAMLNSLGYCCGEEDDNMGEKTLAAVQAFQEDYGLDVLADDAREIDETTLAKIEAAYLGLEDEEPRTEERKLSLPLEGEIRLSDPVTDYSDTDPDAPPSEDEDDDEDYELIDDEDDDEDYGLIDDEDDS
jgi:hypothetical protein